MTDSNYTALLLIVDRSGSMTSIREDMEGGLKELLREQAAEPGLLTVDVVTFDNAIEVQHVFADPKTVNVVIEPRGGTALLDAVGLSINAFSGNLAGLPEHARPGQVQVVIVTDGEENSSQEYSGQAVRDLVAAKEKEGWDFIFLGANQDAALAGERLGIARDKSMKFGTNKGNIDGANMAVSRYLKDKRKGETKGFTEQERFDADDEGDS